MTGLPTMTAFEHYAEAEDYLRSAKSLTVPEQRERARDLTELASVHATLAVAGFIQTLVAVKVGDEVLAQIAASITSITGESPSPEL
ncbi:hypothetical protein BIZ71_gp52 [Gordonia phage Hedwig]|uniref:Uncharacterized protein n=1 Tax=Gordonia phage Hedwig TaxID=1887648 RepID=A0A1C9EHX2_9CAUD|nr:hypothetical protein BIZ71_gp52 [Gordonia phage Hedwig]AON97345.1 hypothetical protein SEA_HEDWIG_52 [Gordonia phage Hedwig]